MLIVSPTKGHIFSFLVQFIESVLPMQGQVIS